MRSEIDDDDPHHTTETYHVNATVKEDDIGLACLRIVKGVVGWMVAWLVIRTSSSGFASWPGR